MTLLNLNHFLIIAQPELEATFATIILAIYENPRKKLY